MGKYQSCWKHVASLPAAPRLRVRLPVGRPSAYKYSYSYIVQPFFVLACLPMVGELLGILICLVKVALLGTFYRPVLGRRHSPHLGMVGYSVKHACGGLGIILEEGSPHLWSWLKDLLACVPRAGF